MNIKSMLQNVYLFKSMKQEQLEKVAAATHTEKLSARQDIFSEGDKAFALYLITRGSVRIHQRAKSGENNIITLGTGAHFGEMAYMDNEARSASATTAEETEILVVPYEKLNGLLKADPELAVQFYKELAHFLWAPAHHNDGS